MQYLTFILGNRILTLFWNVLTIQYCYLAKDVPTLYVYLNKRLKNLTDLKVYRFFFLWRVQLQRLRSCITSSTTTVVLAFYIHSMCKRVFRQRTKEGVLCPEGQSHLLPFLSRWPHWIRLDFPVAIPVLKRLRLRFSSNWKRRLLGLRLVWEGFN